MCNCDCGNEQSQPSGDCFVAAFNTLFDMMADPESDHFVLVHGSVAHLPQDIDVNHAWVEGANMVFDYSNGFRTEMPKDEYYSQLQVTTTRRYTPMEAIRMSAQHDHYGPWPSQNAG